MTKPKLTPKQAAFVKEYLTDFNATAAAERAGYSPRTAGQQGHRLLKNVEIQAELANYQAEAKTDAVMSLRELQEWWSSVTKGDAVPMTIGGDEPVTINTIPDLKDRLKASELLGKSKGAFIDKVDHTTGGQPLKAYIGFDPEDV